jgi:hypothetical protein
MPIEVSPRLCRGTHRGLTVATVGVNPSITEEMWTEGVRKQFKSEIIVGKDLMEI